MRKAFQNGMKNALIQIKASRAALQHTLLNENGAAKPTAVVR